MRVNFTENRKIASELIFSVLTGRNCVREVLKQFPSDEGDLSIQCAWHALIHYEADEDIRKKDFEYKQEQDDYLEMIAFILKDGNFLPQNILAEYLNYYENASISRTKSFKNWVKSLISFKI